MAELTTDQYDDLERAIAEGQRVAIYRRGTEYLVVPLRLRLTSREAVECMHPTTGERLTLYIDEIEGFEVVG